MPKDLLGLFFLRRTWLLSVMGQLPAIQGRGGFSEYVEEMKPITDKVISSLEQSSEGEACTLL